MPEAEEPILNTSDRERIETVVALCRTMRDRLHPGAPFRLRVLVDMTLLELDRELARLGGKRPPDGNVASP